MNQVSEFVVGEHYTNDQIRFALGLENLGGIRPSLDSSGNVRHLAIMTAAETYDRVHRENPYHDRIEGDVLLYTAQGKHGDQQLTGRNKRLVEQYEIPLPFFCFVNQGRQVYEFIGLLELVRHYQETQADIQGALRKAWVFEFKIHRDPEIVPIDLAASIAASVIGESRAKNPLQDAERELADLPEEEMAISAPERFYEAEHLRSVLFEIEPYRFEHLVAAVIQESGFRDVRVTQCSGDGGIDASAFVSETNDFLGGTYVQFQAKRWRRSVGSVEVKGFRGALEARAKGVFVTTSHYTRAATEEAAHPGKLCVTLVDGLRLSSLIFGHGIDIDSFR